MPIGSGPITLYTTNGIIVEDGATGTPNIVVCSSSATANTFGTWAEVDASTSADSFICSLSLNSDVSVTSKVIIEIGTGAAASEATKIRFSTYWIYKSNIGLYTPILYTLPIPVKVSSGTRIAVRASDDQAAAYSYSVGIQYYQSL